MRHAIFAAALTYTSFVASGCGQGAYISPEIAVPRNSQAQGRAYLPPSADARMTPDAARKLILQRMMPADGSEFDFNYAPITEARISLTRLTLTTAKGEVSLPLVDFDAACRGRDKGIYVMGALHCGDFSFNWRSPDDGVATGLVAALATLQKEAAELASEQDEQLFKDVVERARITAEKPEFGENAIRLKVQAEAAVKEKNFVEAAVLFKKALDIAPWWPEGHFNLSLILSETGDFELAIREMKRYILLAPEASNARSAQNKIYEWERKVEPKATTTAHRTRDASARSSREK